MCGPPAQPPSNFHENGAATLCKSCQSEANRLYYQRNKERLRERHKKYRDENPEKRSEAFRRWREKNRESKAEYDRQWIAAHPGKKAEYDRRYYEANRDRWRVYKLRRRALEESVRGEVSAEIIRGMYEDQDGLCAYCEAELDDSFHADHMTPLSEGGAHDWSNLALACSACNLSKGVKTAEEFMGGVR